MTRESLRSTRRWVVKIGSALITNDGQGLNHEAIQSWVQQIAGLRESGKEVLLVSSGAVAEGMARLAPTPEAMARVEKTVPLGRTGTPADIGLIAEGRSSVRRDRSFGPNPCQ